MQQENYLTVQIFDQVHMERVMSVLQASWVQSANMTCCQISCTQHKQLSVVLLSFCHSSANTACLQADMASVSAADMA